MRSGSQEELKIRTRSQELAVAWGKGRAGYVLNTLSREEPSRAALMATFIFEALSRWDPSDTRFPTAFRQALLVRSQGLLTTEEYLELVAVYRRRFGKRPPSPPPEDACELMNEGRRICEALERGEPIAPQDPHSSPMFLRERVAAGRTSREVAASSLATENG